MRAAWLALFFALSSWAPLSAQALPSPSSPPAYEIKENELARCLAISMRLEVISSELKNKIELSEARSKELETELAASRTELSELRASLESSATHSEALGEALTKSETSLASLEKSFAAYKTAAELKIASQGVKIKLLAGSNIALVIVGVIIFFSR